MCFIFPIYSFIFKSILDNLPDSRQTLLFSATLSQSVTKLARLSLNKPQYIKVLNNNTVGTNTFFLFLGSFKTNLCYTKIFKQDAVSKISHQNCSSIAIFQLREPRRQKNERR